MPDLCTVISIDCRFLCLQSRRYLSSTALERVEHGDALVIVARSSSAVAISSSSSFARPRYGPSVTFDKPSGTTVSPCFDPTPFPLLFSSNFAFPPSLCRRPPSPAVKSPFGCLRRALFWSLSSAFLLRCACASSRGKRSVFPVGSPSFPPLPPRFSPSASL